MHNDSISVGSVEFASSADRLVNSGSPMLPVMMSNTEFSMYLICNEILIIIKKRINIREEYWFQFASFDSKLLLSTISK